MILQASTLCGGVHHCLHYTLWRDSSSWYIGLLMHVGSSTSLFFLCMECVDRRDRLTLVPRDYPKVVSVYTTDSEPLLCFSEFSSELHINLALWLHSLHTFTYEMFAILCVTIYVNLNRSSSSLRSRLSPHPKSCCPALCYRVID